SPNPFFGADARGVACACRRAMQSINRLCSLQLQKNQIDCAYAEAQSIIRGENGLAECLPACHSSCLSAERFAAVPFVFDSPHQERAIEFNGTWREQLPIFEEAGFHVFHSQWLNLPVKAAKLQTIELLWLGSNRVAQRPSFKECGSLLK